MESKLFTGTETAVRHMEREFAARAKQIRAAYKARMNALRKDFVLAEKRAAAQEIEALKANERQRLAAIAALTTEPLILSDFRSVRREAVSGQTVDVAMGGKRS